MKKSALFANRIILALVIVATGCMVATTYAAFKNLQRPPSVVVTFNIEQVFDQIDARVLADRELQTAASELERETKAKQYEVDQLKEDLEAFAPGTDAHDTAQADLLQATLEFQGMVEFARRKLEVKKARVLGRLYEDIRTASKDLATREGWDYVFVDDSISPLQANTEVEMMRQISARRFIYSTDQNDVTAELIKYMNEQG